jgi:hypothetical protein
MLDRDEITYTTLKAYADMQRQERKKRGIKEGFSVANLLVLARQNDPFYAGNPAGVTGKFTEGWTAFALKDGILI